MDCRLCTNNKDGGASLYMIKGFKSLDHDKKKRCITVVCESYSCTEYDHNDHQDPKPEVKGNLKIKSDYLYLRIDSITSNKTI